MGATEPIGECSYGGRLPRSHDMCTAAAPLRVYAPAGMRRRMGAINEDARVRAGWHDDRVLRYSLDVERCGTRTIADAGGSQSDGLAATAQVEEARPWRKSRPTVCKSKQIGMSDIARLAVSVMGALSTNGDAV